MQKKVTGLILALVIFLSPCVALAALPENAIAYKTVLKTDDFYVAVRTDTVEWTAVPDGGTTVAITVRWAYVRPEKFARNYPAVKQSFSWRLSRYAMRFEPVFGAAMLMDLETVLIDRNGEPVAQFKGDRKGWRLLNPADPEYEAFEQVIGYLAEKYK